MARAFVGTSGWTYKNWRGLFYPPKLPARQWLAFYAENLRTLELNTSFYRLPPERAIEGWVEQTPKGFVFATKGARLITHMKRLRDSEPFVKKMLERLAGFGPKLGPILFQLPPHFPKDEERLARFLKLLPRGRRFAFEFRNPSWHCKPVYALLAKHDAAFCMFEIGDQCSPRVATADFVYARLHGRGRRYHANYDDRTLASWARWLRARMKEGRDAYVYFDNTDEADHAPRNALDLGRRLASASSER